MKIEFRKSNPDDLPKTEPFQPIKGHLDENYNFQPVRKVVVRRRIEKTPLTMIYLPISFLIGLGMLVYIVSYELTKIGVIK